jgi:hypothetical protein
VATPRRLVFRLAEATVFTAFAGLFGLETAGVVLLLTGEAPSSRWLIGAPLGMLAGVIIETLQAATEEEGTFNRTLFAILATLFFGAILGGLAIVAAESMDASDRGMAILLLMGMSLGGLLGAATALGSSKRDLSLTRFRRWKERQKRERQGGNA